MRVDLFDFELPRELIAARPADPRDSSRLLRIGEAGLDDRRFAELPELLEPGDMLVFNDTRVIPVRLAGRRGGLRVEATLHKSIDEFLWDAFAKPARKLKIGDHLSFGEDFAAEVLRNAPGCSVTEQTDGWVAVEIVSDAGEGPILDLLERLVNLDPVTLRPGKASRTVLEHLGVFVIRRDEDRLAVIGMRSAGGSLWHALSTAAHRLEGAA